MDLYFADDFVSQRTSVLTLYFANGQKK